MKLLQHIVNREIRAVSTLGFIEITRIIMGASQAVAVTPSFALLLGILVAVLSMIEYWFKQHKNKELST